ncbi:MAG TPA: hypothetical protein VJX67_21910, partial [Blastocatellia bacterium]|nr:hypothetical protein [Blastocatellia bacterium]
MSTFAGKAILIGLGLIIVFTALAHGAVEPWSVAVFELLTVLLILLWAAKAVIDKRITVQVPRTCWPLFVLLVLAVFQSIAWQDGDGYRKSLSMDVESTRSSALALFSLVICS